MKHTLSLLAASFLQGTAGGGEAQPGDGFGRWGRGHLLRVTAAKLKAASDLGIEVIDEDGWLALVGG